MNDDQVRVALHQLSVRRHGYQLPRDYYEGRHRLLFATDRFRNVFGGLFSAFADNFCAPVVDAVNERLEITGFTTPDGAEATAAKGVWTANRMDAQVTHLHQEALVEGDAYLIVWPNKAGVPIVHLNRASRVTVVYSEETPWEVEYAIKVWRHGRHTRLNVYYPDRIERYVTKGETQGFPRSPSVFTDYTEDGGKAVIPHNWGRVPVFHFPNRARIGALGRSELTDAIPVNDAVNKLCADMLVGSEFVALPQRWATGVEEEVNPVTGRKEPPFQPGVERMLTVGNDQARFGQFDPADFRGPLDLMHAFVTHLAAVTGTPPHYFYSHTGDWPSGEALRTAEARLVAKANARVAAWGPVWADAMSLAVRMLVNSGQPGPLETVWARTATRVEREELEIAEAKVRLGVSRRRVLVELGYSDEEVDKMLEERASERLQAAEDARRAFDAGAIL